MSDSEMSAVPDSDSASRSEPMDPFDQVLSDAMDRAEAANDGSSSGCHSHLSSLDILEGCFSHL